MLKVEGGGEFGAGGDTVKGKVSGETHSGESQFETGCHGCWSEGWNS